MSAPTLLASPVTSANITRRPGAPEDAVACGRICHFALEEGSKMGFELIPGWAPEEPTPIALCDNPACPDPIMPATGWAIAALAASDAARSSPPRAVRTYLACSEVCLATIRRQVGGAWTAPLPYAAYWRAISPRVVADLTETERARLAQVRARRQARAAGETSPGMADVPPDDDYEGQAPAGEGWS